ncbi:MAG: DNA cytosine methyltransferase [Bacteroidia bacterium]
MNELHLFAGIGGGILGGKLLGHTTVCAVEINRYCRKVLLQRQRDGMLPKFPIWDDVRTFDGIPWNGKVEIICGGFPCQDISVAGKGKGINGDKSGLWKQMHRIICEIRPKFVFLENSPAIIVRGLESILADLASAGYNAEWGMLGCGDVGGWHSRKRFWLLASNNCSNGIQRDIEKTIYKFKGVPWIKDVRGIKDLRTRHDVPKPLICGASDGISNWMDRLKSIGNAQVPLVAAIAFQRLYSRRNKC